MMYFIYISGTAVIAAGLLLSAEPDRIARMTV